jgi:hypothetical protein
MSYTVWSRGRLIGETDLGFVRVFARTRFGWFHPNADGERSMSVIASVLPAVRAYFHRDAGDAGGRPRMQPAPRGSSEFADLAEAYQHLGSLDLELRREDGSVVPTADIGIQDLQQLMELFPVEDDIDADEEFNKEVDEEFDDDLAMTEGDLPWQREGMSDMDVTERVLAPYFDEPDAEWTPDDLEEPQHPRYQIYVRLLRDDAIP